MDTIHLGETLSVFVESPKILSSQDNVNILVETIEADDCG